MSGITSTPSAEKHNIKIISNYRKMKPMYQMKNLLGNTASVLSMFLTQNFLITKFSPQGVNYCVQIHCSADSTAKS